MIAPPYPVDTRAKGWRFEIDHERIRQSDTWALASPEVRPWLLMLWMVAWEQTPCGSLPGDDALIAVRIGMSPHAFSKHRALLLRGWVKSDEGRLYHPVLIERVLEMLQHRARSAERTAKSRAPSRESQVSNSDVTCYTPVTNEYVRVGSPPVPVPVPVPEPEPEPKSKESKSKPFAASEKISLSAGGWENTEGYRETWTKAYPAVEIDVELARAHAWLQANPKQRKSNYARFLNNWFSKVQDRNPRLALSGVPKLTQAERIEKAYEKFEKDKRATT